MLEGTPHLSKRGRHADFLWIAATLLARNHLLYLSEHLVDLNELVLDDTQHWEHLRILQVDP